MGDSKHVDFELHAMLFLLGIPWATRILRSSVLSSWAGQRPQGRLFQPTLPGGLRSDCHYSGCQVREEDGGRGRAQSQFSTCMQSLNPFSQLLAQRLSVLPSPENKFPIFCETWKEVAQRREVGEEMKRSNCFSVSFDLELNVLAFTASARGLSVSASS